MTHFGDDSFKEKVEEKKWHEEEVLNTQAYKQASKYMKDLIDDIRKGLFLVSLVSSRDYETFKDSALIFGTSDLIGSVTAIDIVTSEIVLNAVKRELRYMLEATIKYAAVDQLCKGKTLEEKLDYFYQEIPRSSIAPIDELNGLTESMVKDTKELYSKLSQFTHPSKIQITEYQIQFKKGTLGYQTHKEIDSFNRLLFRTCDILLYIILRNIGYYERKDFFDCIEGVKNWRYFKGKYVKTLLPKKFGT